MKPMKHWDLTGRYLLKLLADGIVRYIRQLRKLNLPI